MEHEMMKEPKKDASEEKFEAPNQLVIMNNELKVQNDKLEMQLQEKCAEVQIHVDKWLFYKRIVEQLTTFKI